MIESKANVAESIRRFWSLPSKKSIFKFSSSNDLRTVENAAEEEPDNPRKQAALYRVRLLNCFSSAVCVISV